MAEEVGEMRLALLRLQSSNAPPSKPAKGSLDAALAKARDCRSIQWGTLKNFAHLDSSNPHLLIMCKPMN